MAAQNTSALLIGSWKYDKTRRDRDDNHDKSVGKKGGIKRTVTKSGKVVPEKQWATGDLDYMQRLMRRKEINVFDRLDYQEQKEDGSYARGKVDVLRMIDEFFKQKKARFLLYFTGHGAKQDGSWCFAVTTRAGKGSRSSTRNAEDDRESIHERAQGNAASGKSPATGASSGATNEGIGEIEHAAGVTSSLTSLLAGLDQDGSQPDPTDKWNDFVTYEEVLKLWDENKGEEERFLMMILDCCHSGKWVDKVNGVEPERNNPSNAPDATNQPCIRKRNDVCIQAACRPTEESTVANDQLSSFFYESIRGSTTAIII